jgi:hypothetical protein
MLRQNASGYEVIKGDCVKDFSCAKAIALEKYSLQVKYASNPDWNKVIYFYNSNGKNIGRIGWEPDRWYIHGCGANGHFNYLTKRQATDKEQTWTITKSPTHLNIYVEETHLATIDFQANNCLDDYGGNVVSAVSFQYFATQSGSWREKPLSKKFDNQFFQEISKFFIDIDSDGPIIYRQSNISENSKLYYP